jgi:hypothetical protein
MLEPQRVFPHKSHHYTNRDEHAKEKNAQRDRADKLAEQNAELHPPPVESRQERRPYHGNDGKDPSYAGRPPPR